MYNNYMTVNQYNLFQSQLQWYNELCLSQQNNYNQLCQLQLNQQKHCSICRIFKPYTEFHKWNRSKDGFRSQCKQCRYNDSHRPEVQQYKKEYDTKYREENRDKLKEYNKNYYVEHNDYFREY